MRQKKKIGVILAAVILIQVMAGGWSSMTALAAEEAPEELQNLHAQSAVLMDAGSGRILFEKNGYEKRAMASTTKIMTCILALENKSPGMIVTVSETAVRQPKVHLGMERGEQFYLEDLLYSLMLESHNDSAVAVAEQIGGSVAGFAALMNEKAMELGCRNTHFVTPNGLDASDERGRHSTTAAELARILQYCIMESPAREEFLKITQTGSHSFQDIDGKRSFTCNNHNVFLNMMDGALTGKTGFTSEAGYCYVGALKRDGKVFIVALLACGWPSHRNYKWQDARALMNYGTGHYHYRKVDVLPVRHTIEITGGRKEGQGLFEKTVLNICTAEATSMSLLLRDDEQVETQIHLAEQKTAPVKKGEVVGSITYLLHGQQIRKVGILAAETIQEKDYCWTLQKVAEWYFLKKNEEI